jgi:hypothetical protein
MSRAAYMREYRARTKSRRAKDRWWVSTRAAAMEQLAMEYPARFQEILAKIRTDNPGPWAPEET